MEKWDEEFESIEDAIEALEVFRGQILFGEIGEELPAMAEQHYLAALGALEQAKAHLRLAAILKVKEKEE